MRRIILHLVKWWKIECKSEFSVGVRASRAICCLRWNAVCYICIKEEAKQTRKPVSTAVLQSHAARRGWRKALKHHCLCLFPDSKRTWPLDYFPETATHACNSTHTRADAHMNISLRVCHTTRMMDMQTKLFLSFCHMDTHAHTPTIKFSNELPLSNEAQRKVYITPAWHDPSADIITTWWEVVMTHEQRTFGASPKYDTVTITHITCLCDDFAIMALSYSKCFSNILSFWLHYISFYKLINNRRGSLACSLWCYRETLFETAPSPATWPTVTGKPGWFSRDATGLCHPKRMNGGEISKYGCKCSNKQIIFNPVNADRSFILDKMESW